MYAVIGAGGFLGSYIVRNLMGRTDEEILATTRAERIPEDGKVTWVRCDVSDKSSLTYLAQRINRGKKVKIIYLPAYFNTGSRYDRRAAWQVNIVDYAEFLSMIDGFDAFYSVSTDMVFSEDSDAPYREDAPVSPLNDYARHKIAEEGMAAAAGVRVVRLPVMMGRSLSPHKKHFFDEIIEQNRRGVPMKFFSDVWRSIIDFNTAAGAILDLMECREAADFPIVNIAGDEALSKYDVALRMARHYRLDASLMQPVSMHDDTDIWKEKRPGKVLLDNTLVKKLLRRTEMKFSFDDRENTASRRLP